jgi:flavin reductase (DIM6/NTAB) family NADH-FMN oxidoreductase RutF
LCNGEGNDQDEPKANVYDVSPPLIEECAVNPECKVRRGILLGSHHLFPGEIVALHMDDTILGEKEQVDIAQAAQALPQAYCEGDHAYWTRGKGGMVWLYRREALTGSKAL